MPGTLGPAHFPRITPGLTRCHLSPPIWPTLSALSTRSQKRPRPSKESHLRKLNHGKDTNSYRAGLPELGQDHLSHKKREWFGPCRKTAVITLAFRIPLRALGLHHIHRSVWSSVGSGKWKQLEHVHHLTEMRRGCRACSSYGGGDKLEATPGRPPHRPPRLEHLDTESLGTQLCSWWLLSLAAVLLLFSKPVTPSVVPSITTEPVRMPTPRLHWNVASELAFCSPPGIMGRAESFHSALWASHTPYNHFHGQEVRPSSPVTLGCDSLFSFLSTDAM